MILEKEDYRANIMHIYLSMCNFYLKKFVHLK